jgi:hypothetical protein
MLQAALKRRAKSAQQRRGGGGGGGQRQFNFAVPGVQLDLFGTKNGLQVVQVNSAQIATTVAVARGRSPEVRSAVQKILDDTVRCGFDINIVYNGETVHLPSATKTASTADWSNFASDLLWNLLVVGFVVVGGAKGTSMPYIVPFNMVTLFFSYSTRAARKYWAEDTACTNGVRTRMRNVSVYVLHPPTEAGELTSPGYVCLTAAAALVVEDRNTSATNYQLAHPTWPLEQDAIPGQPGADAVDEVVQGETAQIWAEHLAMIQDAHLSNVNAARDATLRMTSGTAASAAGSAAAVAGADAETRFPYLNSMLVPMGMSLKQPVLPQRNSQFPQEYDINIGRILQAFNIPPVIMAGHSTVRYAGETQVAYNQWENTVRYLQRTLGNILSGMFLEFNMDTIMNYCVALMQNITEMRNSVVEKLRERISEALDKRLLEQQQQQHKEAEGGDGEDADDDDSTTDDTDEHHITAHTVTAEQIMQILERNKTQNVGADELEDGTVQLEDPLEAVELPEGVLAVDEKQITDYVVERFKVVVAFKPHSRTNPEQLDMLLQQGVLGLTAYAKLVAGYFEIPETMLLLTAEDRQKEAKERARLTEIATAAQQPPQVAATSSSSSSAAPKKAAAPAAAAAASASSTQAKKNQNGILHSPAHLFCIA